MTRTRRAHLTALNLTTLALLLSAGTAGAASLTVAASYRLSGATGQDAAWFQNGQRFAVATDNTVNIASAAQPDRVLMTLRGPSEPVTHVDVSPAGDLLTAISDGVAYAWSLSDGRLLNTFEDLNVTSAQFRADGQVILVAEGLRDTTVLWNPGKDQVLNLESPFLNLVTSPDGKRAMVADGKGNVTLWDPVAWKAVGQPLPCKTLYALAIAPDGSVGAASCDGRKGLILKPGANRTLTLHGERASLAFASPGVLYAKAENKLQRWNLQSGQGDAPTSHYSGEVLRISPDGQNVIFLAQDVPARIAPLARPLAARELLYPASHASDSGFLNGTPVAASASVGYRLSATPQVITEDETWLRSIASAAGQGFGVLEDELNFEPYLALLGEQGFDTTDDLYEIDLSDAELITASPDGTLVIVNSGSYAELFDATGKKVFGLSVEALEDLDIDPDDTFLDVAVSAGGRVLALITEQGHALRIDTTERELISQAQFPEDTTPKLLASAADGTLAVSVRRGGKNQIWLFRDEDTTPYKQVTLGGWIEDLAFSPDGTHLAVNASGDLPHVIVLRVSDGQEVARSPKLSMYDGGLTWNAAGTQLLVGRGQLGTDSAATLLTFQR
ncbi:hypothetical protein [Deinococcus sp. JMULE3]|uniref:WD40 repeat domain-containing protein n=1 Tax=Deinococcus sp. JMULE3 TaxID=2518341 RepID=UPI0015766A4A|nr:hypothetical protein [Deinococcus sp. JMULE3]NTX99649.1 hypothetical protein [Deinococcus sp. JMULE3]